MEDSILKAYEQSKRFGRYTPTPAPEYPLKVGDGVLVGNLDNCVVEALFEEGRFVVISYTTKPTRDDKEVRIAYNCFPWYDVVAEKEVKDTSFARTPHITSYLNSGLSQLMSKVLHFGVEDSPDFQRDYVWTEEDKVRLLESVFAGRDIGKFIFVKRKYHDLVLDGKQRLKALVDFRLSRYPYKGVYYHQLSRRDDLRFENHMVQYAELPESTTRKEMLEVFLEMNTGGVPQTEEHIKRVKELLKEEK